MGHPPRKARRALPGLDQRQDVPAETTALTLTLAGDPGSYTFQVSAQELQRNGAQVTCPDFSVNGRIEHDTPLSLPGLPGPVPDRVLSRRGGLCAEPEPDDRRERHPLLPPAPP